MFGARFLSLNPGNSDAITTETARQTRRGRMPSFAGGRDAGDKEDGR
jgi:hypothetical protein